MSRKLRIGEVARLLGVTTKTIRHYHAIGVVAEPERTEAGYRLYTAGDLLQLNTVRRLQKLGVPLRQIRAIFGTARDAPTLRAVLEALHNDVAAQIAALEARREAIERLLDGDPATVLDRPVARPATLARLEDFLAAHLPGISPALRQQEEQLWALLDAFDWPAEQVAAIQGAAEHFAASPEALAALHELAERTMALAQLPPDAPEVEQLAAAWHDFQRAHPLPATFAQDGPLGEGLLVRVLADLLSADLAPTQQRLVARLNEAEDNLSGDIERRG